MKIIVSIICSIFLFLGMGSLSSVKAENIVIKQEKVTESEKAKFAEALRRLHRKTTISGSFFQTDNNSKQGKGALGKFYFQQPRKINFTYSPPNNVEVISNGSQVIIKEEKRGRKNKKYYPASSTPLKFLVKDPNDYAYSDVVKDIYSKEDSFFVNVIQDSIFGKNNMTIIFSNTDLSLTGWVVHEKKNNIEVELYDVVYDKDLNQDLFYVEPNTID